MAIQCVAADSHLRSSQAMGLSSQTPFSVTTWMNGDWSAATRSFVGIYGPATDTPLGAPVTAMQIGCDTAGRITCWTWGGGDLCIGPVGGMTPFNGQWVFIAYTYDGTNHRVYVNGAQVGTTTTAQIAGSLNQVYINGYPGGGVNEVYTHQVDQYALYRRTLTADEVLTMYHARGARHGITDACICRYEFDEGIQGSSATGVVDLTGNGHTLTAVGAAAALTPITYTYSTAVANSNIRPVQ